MGWSAASGSCDIWVIAFYFLTIPSGASIGPLYWLRKRVFRSSAYTNSPCPRHTTSTSTFDKFDNFKERTLMISFDTGNLLPLIQCCKLVSRMCGRPLTTPTKLHTKQTRTVQIIYSGAWYLRIMKNRDSSLFQLSTLHLSTATTTGNLHTAMGQWKMSTRESLKPSTPNLKQLLPPVIYKHGRRLPDPRKIRPAPRVVARHLGPCGFRGHAKALGSSQTNHTSYQRFVQGGGEVCPGLLG